MTRAHRDLAIVNIRRRRVARPKTGQRPHKPDAPAKDTTIYLSTEEGDGYVARCVPCWRCGLVYSARPLVVRQHLVLGLAVWALAPVYAAKTVANAKTADPMNPNL